MREPTPTSPKVPVSDSMPPSPPVSISDGPPELDQAWTSRTLDGIPRQRITVHAVRQYRDAGLSLSVVEAPPDTKLRTAYQQAAARRAAVAHPRLLPMAGAGEARGRLYVAFEAGQATPLSDLFSYGPLSPALVATLLRGVAEALDFAAASGLAAYELTPASVFFETGLGGLVGDLGIGRESLGSPQGESDPHAPYVAPETLTSGIADARSGVYSLGALLYYCGTGGTVPAGSRPRGLHGPTRRVIARAMATNPDKRYPSALQALVALEKALGAGSWRTGALARLPSVTPPQRGPRPSPRGLRKPGRFRRTARPSPADTPAPRVSQGADPSKP